MNISFSARHFEPTEKQRAFAVKELERLDKYAEEKVSGEIILEESGDRKIVEARVNAFGRKLNATADGPDFFKVIPKVVDKLTTQLKSTKSKLIDRA